MNRLSLRLIRSSLLMLPIAGLLAACGGETGPTGGNNDMSVTPGADMKSTVDMASPPDLAPPKLTVPTTCMPANVTLATTYSTVISNKCGGNSCHLNGGSQSPRMGTANDFKTYTVNIEFRTGSNGKYIVPSNVDLSYLLYKLTGEHTRFPSGDGSQMPLGTTLTPTELCTVINWVRSGAN